MGKFSASLRFSEGHVCRATRAKHRYWENPSCDQPQSCDFLGGCHSLVRSQFDPLLSYLSQIQRFLSDPAVLTLGLEWRIFPHLLGYQLFRHGSCDYHKPVGLESDPVAPLF